MAIHRPLAAALICLLATPPVNAIEYPQSVPGWTVSGSAAAKYAAVIDKTVAYDGSASASLTAIARASGSEFGTLMQIVDARAYNGQRLRLSAQVRTAGVSTGAALWMRIDGADGDVLAFDNMSRRGLIRGDQAWTPLELVLDVPPGGHAIFFGVLLKGEGMVWIDEVALNPVMRHVATTGFEIELRLPATSSELPDAPDNVDFERW